MVQPLWKTVWLFLKKSKTELPYDPAIQFLGLYPRELRSGIWTDICVFMLIAALSTRPKRWKQLKCLSVEERITGMWSVHTVEYYSAL